VPAPAVFAPAKFLLRPLPADLVTIALRAGRDAPRETVGARHPDPQASGFGTGMPCAYEAIRASRGNGRRGGGPLGRKIAVDSELYAQLKQCAEAGGYSSPEEFAIHVLEKEVDRLHGGAPQAAALEAPAVEESPAETIAEVSAAEPVPEESGEGAVPAPFPEQESPE